MKQSPVEANKSIIARLYNECFNERKWNLVDELLAPDFVNHLAKTRGREAFLRTMKALSDAFADIHFTIEDLFGEGDRVAVRWTMRGRHVGKFQSFEPTGKLSEQQTNVIYRVEGGKLKESWIGPGPVRISAEPSPNPASSDGRSNQRR